MFSFLIIFINVPREESAKPNGNIGLCAQHSMEAQGRDAHRDLTPPFMQIEYVPKLCKNNVIDKCKTTLKNSIRTLSTYLHKHCRGGKSVYVS